MLDVSRHSECPDMTIKKMDDNKASFMRKQKIIENAHTAADLGHIFVE